MGIRQFYLGYIPKEFLEKYKSNLSLNRRNNIKEQFINLDTLYKIIDTIHKSNGTVYLALNHITNNQTMLEYSKLVYELLHNKVDGIIVSNITIATFLKNQNYTNMIISNLFGNYSIQSVEFLITHFNP